MRWVIHIGTQKTGSKAIQRFLATSAHNIPDRRVLFAPQGRQGTWHRPLFMSLFDGEGRDLKAAVSEIDPQDWDIGVISFEALHELLPHRIRIIRELLGSAQIILFIRPQVDFINSLLNQYAKSHRLTSTSVRRFASNLNQYNPHFDYQEIIGKWADVFGVEMITPIIYDKRSDAVPLFCDAIGVGVPTTYKLVANPNPALSRDAYQAFLSAKDSVSDVSDLPALVRRLHQVFQDEMIDTLRKPGPLLLDEQTCVQVMRMYETSNEQVRAQWFPSRLTLFE